MLQLQIPPIHIRSCVSHFLFCPGGGGATLAQSDADMGFGRRIIRKLYTNIQFIKKF